jgi:hypothetical protein
MFAVKAGGATTATVPAPTHPPAVTVTLYIFGQSAEAVEFVPPPPDHKNVNGPVPVITVAVAVPLHAPKHNGFVAVMLSVGIGFTVTETVPVPLEHPVVEFVPTTE